MKIIAQLSEMVKREAFAAEEKGMLTENVLEAAYQQNWFKLFVPPVYGGSGKQLPEILRLEEELACLDGSLAWTVTLCAGAAWFSGFLDPLLAKKIFEDKKVCFAGSGAVGGTAKETENGFLINGLWKYATGALHATVFTANCLVQNSRGEEILEADGSLKVLSFILMKQEVSVVPDWSCFGLIATGSHTFKVVNVQVPKNRAFKISNQEIKVAGESFSYPFLQLAETTLAVNNLGMAKHFVELAEEAFFKRSGHKHYQTHQITFFKTQLEKTKDCLAEQKENFYKIFEQSWIELQKTGVINPKILANLSKISKEMAHACWQSVQKLYLFGGLEAAKKDTELNRVWRDIHTASQHSLLTFIS